MKNEQLKYQKLNVLDKNTFIKEIKKVPRNEYPKLLMQLREIDDLDFAEETFRNYIYDTNISIAETALYSLGYLGIIKNKLIDLSIINELEDLANKNHLLKDVIDDTIWEIKQPWEEIKK